MSISDVSEEGKVPVIRGRDEWPLVTQESRMKKGKLVRVQIRPGQYVKMYEADARAEGLLFDDSEPKKREKPDDKRRKRPADKGRPETAPIEKPEPEPEAEPEDEDQPFVDFKTIPGIGEATERALVNHGITTFEALAAAEDLDFLAERVLDAIADWRLMWQWESDEPEADDLEGDDVG